LQEFIFAAHVRRLRNTALSRAALQAKIEQQWLERAKELEQLKQKLDAQWQRTLEEERALDAAAPHSLFADATLAENAEQSRALQHALTSVQTLLNACNESSEWLYAVWGEKRERPRLNVGQMLDRANELAWLAPSPAATGTGAPVSAAASPSAVAAENAEPAPQRDAQSLDLVALARAWNAHLQKVDDALADTTLLIKSRLQSGSRAPSVAGGTTPGPSATPSVNASGGAASAPLNSPCEEAVVLAGQSAALQKLRLQKLRALMKQLAPAADALKKQFNIDSSRAQKRASRKNAVQEKVERLAALLGVSDLAAPPAPTADTAHLMQDGLSDLSGKDGSGTPSGEASDEMMRSILASVERLEAAIVQRRLKARYGIGDDAETEEKTHPPPATAGSGAHTAAAATPPKRGNAAASAAAEPESAGLLSPDSPGLLSPPRQPRQPHANTAADASPSPEREAAPPRAAGGALGGSSSPALFRDPLLYSEVRFSPPSSKFFVD
jgi:hypothetical protein